MALLGEDGVQAMQPREPKAGFATAEAETRRAGRAAPFLHRGQEPGFPAPFLLMSSVRNLARSLFSQPWPLLSFFPPRFQTALGDHHQSVTPVYREKDFIFLLCWSPGHREGEDCGGGERQLAAQFSPRCPSLGKETGLQTQILQKINKPLNKSWPHSGKGKAA